MTFSASVVAFEDAAYDRLLHRARERGLSLAEGRALEWLLDGGEIAKPLSKRTSSEGGAAPARMTASQGRASSAR